MLNTIIRIFVYFLALICSSCTHQNKILINDNIVRTISYDIKYPSSQELYRTAKWILNDLNIGNLNRDWEIQMINEYIVGVDPTDNTYIFTDGISIQSSKQIVIFPHQNCLADSAITRELVYALGYDINDEQVGPLVEKIIEDTKYRAIIVMCGKGYVSKSFPVPQFRSQDG